MSNNTAKRLLPIFRDAMELERRGHAFYLEAAEITADPRGKKTFLTLARDEWEHLSYLDKALRALRRNSSLPALVAPPSAVPNWEPTRPTVFVSPKQAVEEIKAGAGELDALKRGMEAEKDSIALYNNALAAALTEEEKQLFGTLVAWEESHLTILQGEHDYVTKTGFWFGYQEFDLEIPG